MRISEGPQFLTPEMNLQRVSKNASFRATVLGFREIHTNGNGAKIDSLIRMPLKTMERPVIQIPVSGTDDPKRLDSNFKEMVAALR